jgi:Bacterial Ig-like domain (group 1)/PKD domain
MVAHGLVRFRSRRPLGLVTALALGLAATGMACHKMPLVAPSGTSITLVAATNVLPVNGSTDITAVLVEGGQTTGTGAGGGTTTVTAGAGTPVNNGTLVSFTTSLGKIEPAQARTDNGKAIVKLLADGHSGTATITAFSGAATQTLDVLIGAAAVARVQVTASPQTLPPTGGTVTITAQAQDQEGNGLLGVPVSFTTTAGSLGTTSVVTDQDGNASTTLTTTAAATVTASVGGGSSGTISGTVAVTVKPRTTVSITPPSTVTVSVPASFTVTVGTSTIVTNVVVDFGDGDTAKLGAISASTNVVHLYGDSGTITVTATATDSEGGVTSASTQVAVGPLQAVGTASPSATTKGAPVVFTVTPTTGAYIDHYEWDFGEGADPISTSSNSMNHAFNSVGTRIVTVKVVPTAGKTITVLITCVIS